MHDCVIREMAAAVSKSLGLKGRERAKVLRALRGCWRDRIAIVWGTEDVFALCGRTPDGKEDPTADTVRPITRDQARDVLYDLLDDHDSTQGVTWDRVQGAIDRALEGG